MTDQNKLVAFCALCFADEDSGSWGCVTIPKANYCTNCSAGGSIIQIPEWAVKSIRDQASWVGKRFYPIQEDYDNQAERKALLNLVETFPGRTARLREDGQWEVTQRKPDGRSVQTWVKANSEVEALRHNSLPYVPEEALKNLNHRV